LLLIQATLGIGNSSFISIWILIF